MEPLKAILYVRVSSDKQIGNTSLADQKRIGREYCKAHNIHLVEIFEERGESAKIYDREELQRALKYCAVHKTIDYFLVYKFDRFSRSVENHHRIKATLSRYGVKLVSITERVEDTPSGRFLENMLAGVAQFDNEVRSERSRTGIKSRLQEGLYPFNAPLGYIDNKNTPGLKHPDPQCFDLFQKAMKRMLTGRYRIKDIVDMLDRWGVKTQNGNPITKKNLSSAFRNPFYAGQITLDSFGVNCVGQHQPMITVEEFNKLQKILESNATNLGLEYKDHNSDFPLNKLIVCEECGSCLAGSWAKKKYGYYSCRGNGCTKRTKGRKEDIERDFLRLLDEMVLSEETIELYKAIVIDVWKERLTEKKALSAPILAELRKLEEKKARIQDLLEEGVYNVGQYRERNQTIETELVVKRLSLSEVDIDENEMETCLNYSLGFLQHLSKFWMKLETADKCRLNRFLFPERLRWRNGKLTTPSLSLVYRQIHHARKQVVAFGVPKLQVLELLNHLKPFVAMIKSFKCIRTELDRVAALLAARS